MRVVVATHGHCFDGLASAAWFTYLFSAVEGGSVDFEYRNCGYGARQRRVDDQMLSGDRNALLDFRFSPSKRLDWYFDHHRTGFRDEADRDVFEHARHDGRRFFFEADYPSCTRLIVDTARARFGLENSNLDDLAQWADTVDTAGFETPQHAIDRSDPIMQLVSVVEHSGDDGFIRRIVPELLRRPLAEVARLPEVTRKYAPLGARHERFVRRVRDTAERRGRVVFVDLTQGATELLSKFVTYCLYPESTYSVVVARLSQGAKISVGYNPWSGHPLDTDISAICARYGGGGHPVVGGISFPASQLDHARAVARKIADELAG